jgi:histidinol-phosphate aminotransferase
MPFRRPVAEAGSYVPSWTGDERTGLVCLDRNESTQPVSGLVAAALQRHIALHGVHGYPELGPLTEAIAGYCGVAPASVLATNGSDQAIDLCLRAFLAEGDPMLVARPEFPMFGHIAGWIGARVVGVPFGPALEFPYQEFAEAAATGRPRVIVLINPNNPTGTPVDRAFIEHMLAAHPDVPVIVDEAYFEFTGTTVVDLVAAHDNLVVLRTFSKAFAMAGLRLGYLVAHPGVVAQLSKLRGPFDVNALAVVAAEAQLAAVEEVRRHAAHVMEVVKPEVTGYFRRSGVAVWPGAANFSLVRPRHCAEAVELLRSSGMLVRPMQGDLLGGTFRVSMGSSEEMARFTQAYQAYLDRYEG